MKPTLFITLTFAFLSLGQAQPVQLGELVTGRVLGRDDFGFSISTDHSTILVGSPQYGAPPLEVGSGGAFVFENEGVRVFDSKGARWRFTQMLLPSALHDHADFGFSVAIQGEVAVVGAPGFGSGYSSAGVGSAFVFRKSDLNWVLEQQLTPPDGELNDEFGTSVTIGEGFIAVSSPDKAVSDTTSGVVYLYVRDGDEWVQTQKVLSDWRLFGSSMDASGSSLIVGTRGLSNYAGRSAGHVSILDIENGYVADRHEMIANPGSSLQGFGQSVAISGSMAVVGVPGVDLELDPSNIWNGRNAGAAYVFKYDGFAWTHTQTVVADDPGTSDNFGWDVDVSEGQLVVGSIGEGVLGNVHGSAYVFEDLDGELRQVRKLTPDPGATGMKYGWAVGLDRENIVVGTPRLEGFVFAYDKKLIVGREIDTTPPAHPLSIESLSPNPFDSTVQLTVAVGSTEAIFFEVFDSLGRKVFADQLRAASPGLRLLNWDSAGSRSGVYFFRVWSNSGYATYPGVLAR